MLREFLLLVHPKWTIQIRKCWRISYYGNINCPPNYDVYVGPQVKLMPTYSHPLSLKPAVPSIFCEGAPSEIGENDRGHF